MVGGVALRAAINSMGEVGIDPSFVIVLAMLMGGLCTGKWWLDR